MDMDCFRVTRELLQPDSDPLFLKPRLKDALLRRPPFRFLHDVIKGIHQKTGFPEDVFDEGNIDGRKFSDDKEAKAEFLKRVIRRVKEEDNSIDVDPYKILAGLESEQTNTWLQALGRIARRRLTQEPRVDVGERPSIPTGDEGEQDATLVPWLGKSADRPRTARKAPPSREGSLRQTLRRPRSSRGRVSSSEQRPATQQSQTTADCSANRKTEEATPSVKDNNAHDAATTLSLNQFDNAMSQIPPVAEMTLRAVRNLADTLDSMREELDFWQTQAQIYSDQNQSMDSPQADISEYQEVLDDVNQCQRRIQSVREIVFKNDETIEQMLQSLGE